jgi:hypothetical protein
MNIKALLVNGGLDPFILLATEIGCEECPITLPSG